MVRVFDLRRRVLIATVAAAALVTICLRNFARHKVAFWLLAPAYPVLPFAYVASWARPFWGLAVAFVFTVLVYAAVFLLLFTLAMRVHGAFTRSRTEAD